MNNEISKREMGRAVEMITAWMEYQDEAPRESFLASRLMPLANDPQAEVELILGLIQMVGVLLVKVSNETGTSEEQVLQGLALRYTV